jgi:hypothetical protein
LVWIPGFGTLFPLCLWGNHISSHHSCECCKNKLLEGEGIGLMAFIYLYKTEQRNLLQLLEVGCEGGWGGETMVWSNQCTI